MKWVDARARNFLGYLGVLVSGLPKEIYNKIYWKQRHEGPGKYEEDGIDEDSPSRP